LVPSSSVAAGQKQILRILARQDCTGDFLFVAAGVLLLAAIGSGSYSPAISIAQYVRRDAIGAGQLILDQPRIARKIAIEDLRNDSIYNLFGEGLRPGDFPQEAKLDWDCVAGRELITVDSRDPNQKPGQKERLASHLTPVGTNRQGFVFVNRVRATFWHKEKNERRCQRV
jgi:hypothetical protein